MKNLVIVGAGFAGLWAAFSAARLVRAYDKDNAVQITLINKDGYHGIRPRFYENNLDDTRISLRKFLDPVGIKLLVGDVYRIDHKTQKVILSSSEINYDRLILASGSQLHMPNVPGLSYANFWCLSCGAR